MRYVTPPSGAAPLAVLTAVLCLGVAAPAQQPAEWAVDTANSRLVVHVDAAGLLSPFLQDHHFTPEEWSGRLQFDPDRPEAVQVEIDIDADSLRNLQDLSPEDAETVNRQVRSEEVLHVEAHPVIRFTAHALDIDEQTTEEGIQVLQGTLRGQLTVRGKTMPVEIPVSARWSPDWLRAAGVASFRQTDFGINPYSRALGTIAVADRLQVEIDIQAEPAAR